jgi:hypothetical protein
MTDTRLACRGWICSCCGTQVAEDPNTGADLLCARTGNRFRIVGKYGAQYVPAEENSYG